MSGAGTGAIMRYCRACVLPDTRPNLRLDTNGICNACLSHRTRPDIDWNGREVAFRKLVDVTRKKARRYDCVIPVSGGKDSTWQVVKCLEYGLTPLAVTWKTPARTVVGQRNLDNLVSLGVDHVDYQISPKAESRFMLKAFRRFGSTAIPMHLAIFNIPLSIAVRFDIPLIIWGENSAFEYGSADEAHTGFQLDAIWLRTYGVTHGTVAEDWVDEDLPEKSLSGYFGPSPDELQTKGTHAVFLGYYLPWDPTETFSVAQQHGFVSDTAGARTGYYDFADIDDDFISIHHWLKWYKFGFTRLFDNLALEIRNGRMTRDDAITIIRAAGDQTPHSDISKFCDFSGISTDEFFAIAETFRNHDIWFRDNGVWKIKDFLIQDWKWA